MCKDKYFILNFGRGKNFNMKKALCLIIATVIVAAAYMAWVRYVSERSIVIISTTDVHAKVENFPRLATAIALSLIHI